MYKVSRVFLTAAVLILTVGCILIARQWAAVVLAAGLVLMGLRKGYKHCTTLGSARWATPADLGSMLNAATGVPVGRLAAYRPDFTLSLFLLFDRRMPSEVACKRFLKAIRVQKLEQPLVRLRDAVHIAVMAPTGVGKSVSMVIPHLLTCHDSCVVLDFKGELALATAAHRHREFGHDIVVLDPFMKVTQQPDTFNPLDFIDANSPDSLDECRDLAEAVVVRTGQEKEPHWNDSAEVWIAGMTAFIVSALQGGDDRSLQGVRTLLTNPVNMKQAVAKMGESDAWEGMLPRLGNQLQQYQDKELASTLTTVNRHMRFLDTPAIAASTKRSSFDPAGLRNGRMTIYLVLPPEHARAQAGLLRMWVGSFLRAVVKGGLQQQNKVHFILDEAASLGHLESIDDALDKYRGYGVRLQLYYQSLGQLKKCFPEGQDQTLLSNCSQVYFGVNDYPTAEHVSNMLGEETIIVDSWGTSYGTSEQRPHCPGQGTVTHSWNRTSNQQQHARKLLKPEEVLQLPPRVAMTFTPGFPPIWTTLLPYFAGDYQPPSAWKKRREALYALVSSLMALVVALMVAGQVWVATSAHKLQPVPAVPREQPQIPEERDIPAPPGAPNLRKEEERVATHTGFLRGAEGGREGGCEQHRS